MPYDGGRWAVLLDDAVIRFRSRGQARRERNARTARGEEAHVRRWRGKGTYGMKFFQRLLGEPPLASGS